MKIPKRHKHWTIPGFKNYIIYKNGIIVVRKKFLTFNIGDIIPYDKKYIVKLYSDNLKKFIDINIVKLLITTFIGEIDLPIKFISNDNGISDYDYILNTDQIKYDNDCVYIQNKKFKKIPGLIYYYISEDGMIYSDKSKFGFLKRSFNSKGYFRVGQIDPELSGTVEIHKLVYKTYYGIIDKGMTIDHIDGDKQNNTYTNLEAVTNSENIRRGYRKGIRDDIKWKPQYIEYICEQMQDGVDSLTLAKHFNITDKTQYSRFKVLCCSLRTGKIWREISSKYDYSKYYTNKKNDMNIICPHNNIHKK